MKSDLKEHPLEFLFNPESIAIVGITTDPDDMGRERFLKPLLDFEFEGQLYLVNPKGGEIRGLKVYPSIRDIPGRVDFVIVSVPAQLSVSVMEDCIAKGVRAVAIYSAGFGEVGTEKGEALEAEITRIARKGGIRVMGPNCMGLYNARSKLSYRSEYPKDGGPVAFLSQSGGNTTDLVQMAVPRGVRFSKIISYGNGRDLDECDFLDYLTHDPDTEIISMYIEGVKDGRRFVGVLGEAAKVKPVILLKGGHGEAGTRATASHTGSLAGDHVAWEGLCRQLGVVQVHTLEELADAIITFLFFPLPQGRRVCLIGVGGGASVLATDACTKNGFVVPPLPEAVKKRLLEYNPQAGSILTNPIDTPSILQESRFRETLKTICAWEGVDMVINFLLSADIFPAYFGSYDQVVKGMAESSKICSKPVALVLQPASYPETFRETFVAQKMFASQGFPVYSTIPRAMNAINKFINYNHRK
ncbi:MAG: CoA-binding protein [Thermodesulfobacteriota bacterium]|nr:CoA-binding protein [Thermodesulfobacteriota bacterium]